MRMTDSARSATEMLLVSQAADKAIEQIDFTPMAGRTVFIDATGIDKDLLDKGYVTSLVRQQLLAAGALMQDDKLRAEYVVDLRIGGLGTDRHSMLVGTPAVQLPSVVPGLPTNLPEIAFMKKNDQRGVAKIAVFAYNRVTGRALWQSGTALAVSRARDTWVMGAGPFSNGTIRDKVELGGAPLPAIPNPLNPGQMVSTPLLQGEQFYPSDQTPPPTQAIPAGVMSVTGSAAVMDRSIIR